jgi:hypothetical protein
LFNTNISRRGGTGRGDMKKLSYGTLVVALVLLPYCSMGQAVPSAGASVMKITSMENHVAIYSMCTNAMSTIQKQVRDLGTKYPSLRDVGGVLPEFGLPCDGEGKKIRRIHQSLRYRKNVSTVANKPDAKGRVPAAGERITIGENGVYLDVFLIEGEVKIGKAMQFPLGVEVDGEELTLFCQLAEVPKNEDMEREVEMVMKTNAKALREQIAEMLSSKAETTRRETDGIQPK